MTEARRYTYRLVCSCGYATEEEVIPPSPSAIIHDHVRRAIEDAHDTRAFVSHSFSWVHEEREWVHDEREHRPKREYSREQRDEDRKIEQGVIEARVRELDPTTWVGFKLDYGNVAHYCRWCGSAMGALRHGETGLILCKACFRRIYGIKHEWKGQGCSCCDNWVFEPIDPAAILKGE